MLKIKNPTKNPFKVIDVESAFNATAVYVMSIGPKPKTHKMARNTKKNERERATC